MIRTLSKAFGFAALRVGYALAHPETAQLLTERRAPAPIAGPSASIAAAALRNPRLGDVDATIAERERMRSSLVAAGYDVRADGDELRLRADRRAARRAARGAGHRRARVSRVRSGPPFAARRRTTCSCARSAPSPAPHPAARRPSSGRRPRPRSGSRSSLDGSGRTRVETGIGFLDHLLTLWAFHAGFDLELLAGGDLDVDEHHTVEDVLAALGSALAQALGTREGVARYGSAVVPMDEARATAAVDLVRRPHAEIALAFGGERVGALAVSLVRHALERFAIEAGCTVHVEAGGADDHHVAEAAYKALGQALRHAVAPGDAGIRSTKGAA